MFIFHYFFPFIFYILKLKFNFRKFFVCYNFILYYNKKLNRFVKQISGNSIPISDKKIGQYTGTIFVTKFRWFGGEERSEFDIQITNLSEHPAGASERKSENALAFVDDCSAVRARTAKLWVVTSEARKLSRLCRALRGKNAEHFFLDCVTTSYALFISEK